MKYCVVSGSSCMFGDAPNSQILSFNSWNHICFVRITNKGKLTLKKEMCTRGHPIIFPIIGQDL